MNEQKLEFCVDGQTRTVVLGSLRVSFGTLARAAVLALTAANQLLGLAGRPLLRFTDAQVTELVNTALLLVGSVVGFWYNNSLTSAALAGDAVMQALKENTEKAQA